jgi:hypothetical protein
VKEQKVVASNVTSAYALKTSSIPKLFEEIKKAAIPQRFTQDFLAGLGFTSSTDRMLIAVLKGLGFLDGNGVPTSVYKEFRDPARSKKILARQIRAAYAGLFELNTQANTFSAQEARGKLSSLTGLSESVVTNMAATFTALCKEADFSSPETLTPSPEAAAAAEVADQDKVSSPALPPDKTGLPRGVAFSHTLNINLPATRDIAVYDAIFRALKEHLL